MITELRGGSLGEGPTHVSVLLESIKEEEALWNGCKLCSCVCGCPTSDVVYVLLEYFV